MNAGRSTDSNKIKNALRKILTNIGNPITDAELPADTGSKFDYGFHNDLTGRLLCPCTLNWNDPACVFLFSQSLYLTFCSVRQGLKDGSIDVESSEHPLLAYENCKYNDTDDEEGLFRNAATIKVPSVPLSYPITHRFSVTSLTRKLAKVIFTSPSSINLDTSKSATRKGNAKLAKLTSMTSRTIAYAHCQVKYYFPSSFQTRAHWQQFTASLLAMHSRIVCHRRRGLQLA